MSTEKAAFPADNGFLRHLLQRCTFGPRPGDVEALKASGAALWIADQLRNTFVDAAANAAVAPYRQALASPEDLYEEIAASMDDTAEKEEKPRGRKKLLREMGGTLQMTALSRHIGAEHQLYEVMVDFWTNHFNIFMRKGATGFVTADFIETVIRPHALGSFGDLLQATAVHPAMLIYLDNWRSFAKAINENYAREVMELHTLGVDGGYSQSDVTELARLLTGWSVEAPGKGRFEFIFRKRMHDDGTKSILGESYGSGESEGRRLLTKLATHPSTAKHLAKKLCQRFVADDPPAALVTKTAAAWTASSGNIATVVGAILASPEFADPAIRGGKIKSPLRFVASAVRALGGTADGTDRLAKAVGRLGQPLFGDPVPTGYPEDSRAWLNSSALLDRMNLAIAFAAEVTAADAGAILPADVKGEALAARIDETLLGGAARPQTREAIRRMTGSLPSPANARSLALAMAIGSPDFQRS